MERLLGRSHEHRQMAALIDGARDGRSGVVVIRGEPGIGKTALLDFAAGHADELQVLRATGVESESQVAFAGLYGFLRPLLDQLPQLPESQSAALGAAFGLGAPIGAERFAIGAATLGLLSLAADAQPLVCVVDDLHWLDVGSRDALLFALRRLGPEGICAFLAIRDEMVGDPPDLTGLHVAELTGLDVKGGVELVQASARGTSDQVSAALVERTRGNPLALIEVSAHLDDSERTGQVPLPDVLPAGKQLAWSFGERIRALSPPERTALLISALEPGADIPTLTAAAAALGITSNTFQRLEENRLLTRALDVLEVRHPIIRSVIVAQATWDETSRIHNALAQVTPNPERAAWHRALAIDSPDEDVAVALEGAGYASAARGDPHAASRALARAAELTPDTDTRARRYVTSGQIAMVAGIPPFPYLDAADAASRDPAIVGDTTIARALVFAWSGMHEPLWPLLDATLPALEVSDPHRAATLHGIATAAALSQFDFDVAMAHGDAAGRLGGDVSLTGDPRSLEFLVPMGAGMARALAGALDEAKAMMAPIAAIVIGGGGNIDTAVPTSASLYAIGEVALAGAMSAELIRRARRTGQLVTLAWSLVSGSWYDVANGNLLTVRANAAEGAELSQLTGLFYGSTLGNAVLATLDALRGRFDRVDESADEWLPRTDAARLAFPASIWREVLGRRYLLAGQPDVALTHLTASTDHLHRLPGGAVYAVTQSNLADLTEAAIRTGRTDLATFAIDRLEALSNAGAGDATQATLHRCRAVAAGDDSFADHFDRALEVYEQLPLGLELAHTRLLYGERLRRIGRRVDGRGHLEAALTTFDRVGADVLAQRAHRELQASGAQPKPRSHDREELTAQELQVAFAVADGASNREAAAGLFLSPKTVEMHLTRVYRKLGIRGRSELVRLVAEGRLNQPESHNP